MSPMVFLTELWRLLRTQEISRLVMLVLGGAVALLSVADIVGVGNPFGGGLMATYWVGFAAAFFAPLYLRRFDAWWKRLLVAVLAVSLAVFLLGMPSKEITGVIPRDIWAYLISGLVWGCGSILFLFIGIAVLRAGLPAAGHFFTWLVTPPAPVPTPGSGRRRRHRRGAGTGP